MIIFENQGNLDSRLITTMGVNVKEHESPIGQFGTGLKYAIAAGLRLGLYIEIQSNGRHYNFFKKPEVIRGKSFDFIEMRVRNGAYEDIPVTHIPLSYTTELGKTWEPWMIYRELLSNMLDEKGTVYRPDGVIDKTPDGMTRILVEGLDNVFDEPGKWFLDTTRQPLAETSLCQIFSGESECIYYKGIRVFDIERKSQFTYNITSHLDLTEDRTAKYDFAVDSIIRRTIAGLTDCHFIETILRCSDSSFEGKIDYNNSIYIAANPSKEFIETVVKLTREDAPTRIYVNSSARDLAQAHSQSAFLPAPRPPTEAETHALNDAELIFSKIGVTVTGVRIIDNYRGAKGSGLIQGGIIWLTPDAFNDRLPHTLLKFRLGTLDIIGPAREKWLIDRLLALATGAPLEPVAPQPEPTEDAPDFEPDAAMTIQFRSEGS